MTIAQLREKGIPPQVALNSVLRSELPDEVKEQAPDMVHLVYVEFKDLTPEQIGEIVFGACVQQITGIRRQA